MLEIKLKYLFPQHLVLRQQGESTYINPSPDKEGVAIDGKSGMSLKIVSYS